MVGKFEIGSQFHFTMEPQTTVCIPAEEGIDVFSASQWMDFTQVAVAQFLGIPENHINMVVRRLGGGYGAKIVRSVQIACACALGTYLTNRTVRFVMTIESNMTSIGKRYALINEYDVDIDDNGKIQKLKNHYAEDSGCSSNEPVQMLTTQLFQNCYSNESWTIRAEIAKTDAPSNTWCRSPGTTEGVAMIENIMEHISRVTGKDPISVRMANIPDDSEMKKLLPEFLTNIGDIFLF